MKMVLILMPGILVLWLAGGPSLAQSQPDPDFLIVPGKSIGKYSLDWTIDKFRAEFGQELSSGSYDGHARVRRNITFRVNWFWWGHLGFGVSTRPDLAMRIVMISIAGTPDNAKVDTLNRQYRTAEGLGLYSSRREVEQKYGSRFLTSVIVKDSIEQQWYRNGVIFEFPNFGPMANVAATIHVVPIDTWL